jgi:hypothetical protein
MGESTWTKRDKTAGKFTDQKKAPAKKKFKGVLREKKAGWPSAPGSVEMPKAETQTVARLLREYAQRTALRGGNPYRAKAYSRAADSLPPSRSRSIA